MTFPYKIGVDRCTGSCNSKNNPYYKILHKTCKCGCLLEEKVYYWNGNKCRWECLRIKHATLVIHGMSIIVDVK